ncbi:MAG: PTS IIA-like nitrogen regulatory protein PtsN [Xanthomonadales bacterium]|jgi:PTS system nitrogen regulatory IIA component|nr:PTS IIA-like nitrogen regulatory protein PtsN [Xanthomonadales bacterium]
MLIHDLLTPDRVSFDVHAGSKKRLLELISVKLAENSDELNQRDVFDSLITRERLGSTGLGNGVAIPHGRISGITQVEAAFFRLSKPMPFEAADGQPVDLVFALAVPEDCGEDHLKLLAHIAELFGEPGLLDAVRSAETPAELLKLITGAGVQ